MSISVDPTDPNQPSGGKPPRPDSEIAILRDVRRRVKALEDRIATAQSITFISPDGRTTKTLSIDNSGNPVWT